MSIENKAEFMQAALSESDDCIKILNLDGSLIFMNAGGMRVMEVEAFDDVKGCPWPDFWEGDGNLAAVAAIDQARSGESARFEGEAKTFKGNARYWDVKVSPIRDRAGTITNILSVSRDITHLKEVQNQLSILSQEAKHRLKNILAIVQAIANQTIRASHSIEDIKATLLDRYDALGRAHDILTQGSWSQAAIHDVIKAALDPLPNRDRMLVEGPDLNLSSKRALGLSLALHELATNAAKYGALSHETGIVKLSWRFDDSDFVLCWDESGGPAPKEVLQKGFGWQIINRILPAYFNGNAVNSLEPDGLHFRLSSPANELLDDE